MCRDTAVLKSILMDNQNLSVSTCPCPHPFDGKNWGFHTDDAVSKFWHEARNRQDCFLTLSIGHFFWIWHLCIKLLTRALQIILTLPCWCENPHSMQDLYQALSNMLEESRYPQWRPKVPRWNQRPDWTSAHECWWTITDTDTEIPPVRMTCTHQSPLHPVQLVPACLSVPHALSNCFCHKLLRGRIDQFIWKLAQHLSIILHTVEMHIKINVTIYSGNLSWKNMFPSNSFWESKFATGWKTTGWWNSWFLLFWLYSLQSSWREQREHWTLAVCMNAAVLWNASIPHITGRMTDTYFPSFVDICKLGISLYIANSQMYPKSLEQSNKSHSPLGIMAAKFAFVPESDEVSTWIILLCTGQRSCVHQEVCAKEKMCFKMFLTVAVFCLQAWLASALTLSLCSGLGQVSDVNHLAKSATPMS